MIITWNFTLFVFLKLYIEIIRTIFWTDFAQIIFKKIAPTNAVAQLTIYYLFTLRKIYSCVHIYIEPRWDVAALPITARIAFPRSHFPPLTVMNVLKYTLYNTYIYLPVKFHNPATILSRDLQWKRKSLPVSPETNR